MYRRFMQLLGIDANSGAGCFLGQHKTVLGHKMLASVRVFGLEPRGLGQHFSFAW